MDLGFVGMPDLECFAKETSFIITYLGLFLFQIFPMALTFSSRLLEENISELALSKSSIPLIKSLKSEFIDFFR